MRPPVLPSGNLQGGDAVGLGILNASMRPPVLPSGNPNTASGESATTSGGFNEAAGFTQRKPNRMIAIYCDGM